MKLFAPSSPSPLNLSLLLLSILGTSLMSPRSGESIAVANAQETVNSPVAPPSNYQPDIGDDDEEDDGLNPDLMHEFFEACEEGRASDIRGLLKEEPELVSAAGDDGQTCLSICAENSEKAIEVIKALIDYNVDLNQRNDNIEFHNIPAYAFHFIYGNVDVVKFLVEEKKIDVNAEFEGMTEEGDMEGKFHPLDLLDFMLRMAPSDGDVADEVIDLVGRLSDVRKILVDNGATHFVGGEEL